MNHEVEFQLVPPGLHQRNASECGMKNWKKHFIAGLRRKDPKPPMNLFYHLLEQCILKLNLLRKSRRNTKMSAYTALEGTFDFNKTPLSPPGCKIIINEKPDARRTCAPHGADGWYIGTDM